MARCKTGRNSCRARIISDAVNNMSGDRCFDVCTTPVCGSPDYLGLFAPLIYDQIGVNLCATFDLDVDILTTYPTATSAWVQIVDIAYTYGEDNVEIEQVMGRKNCYSVTLSNLTLQLAIYIYDSACRLLDTIYQEVLYLPSDITAPTYDEETNPTSVELVLFAPYGISYNGAAGDFTFALNNVAFLSTDNYVRQGLNLYGYPKVLDFDVEDNSITLGLTLILQSLYFAGYNVPNAGKISTPKGSIVTPEETECMRFVAGELLDLAIRPLELGPPNWEEVLKEDCSVGCSDTCVTASD